MKKVVLKLSQLSIPAKIGKTRSIILQMTGNPFFPSPTPTLAVLTASTNAAETAYNKAVNGTPTDTADMRVKLRVMEQQLTALAGYVEFIANQNAETAVEVILSSGMGVKKQGPVNIPILGATGVKDSAGVVRLRRKALRDRVAYVWEQSENGTDWNKAGESSIARFDISGLQSLRRYYFRVATVKRQAQSEWSDAVTFVVS